eukprot:CAMPEP_0170273876 /NCGR_PEP_ID=MMETSP0116_2-20130129/36908_1 /TAXON_ID=400756 /ORGANISM="Durinskia baltica, Strain CSIRO CS-38" /LENGTH=58 /DNA_ID=CAMNT_0010525119 /DNA_START=94 /DNA_END=267 /DNA_ORIENTATION=-
MSARGATFLVARPRRNAGKHTSVVSISGRPSRGGPLSSALTCRAWPTVAMLRLKVRRA